MIIGIKDISYTLGSEQLTNRELEKQYPNWNFGHLETRTGVKSRPISAQGETALDYVLDACRGLIESGHLVTDDVDAIIFCTQTPDHIIPPNACILHGALGFKTDTIAFDITLACSGYPYTLMLAKSMISSGSARNVLIANADTYSRLISPEDRSTRILFGDAGAVSLVTSYKPKYLIADYKLGTAGAFYKRFYIERGGSRAPALDNITSVNDESHHNNDPNHITMDGLGILTFFNTVLPREIEKFLTENALTIDDIDLVIPHQSSAVSLDGLRNALKIDSERFVIDLEETGNLVSASIPIALARAHKNSRIKSKNKILLCGFGVGLSWGFTLIDVV
jgi:3-oxoacyl-[acyl-carrier-protein] synthase-3